MCSFWLHGRIYGSLLSVCNLCFWWNNRENLTTVGRNYLNFPLLSNLWHIYQEYNIQSCRNSFPQCCKRDGRSDKWKQDDMWNMYSILVRAGPLRLLLELYRKLLIYSGTIYSTKMRKRHEIYLLARSVNCILFIFRHPSNFFWQLTGGIRTFAWNKRRLIRPNVAVQLVAHFFSTIEIRVSYFGPELAILSESVVIFLIIQVKIVVVSQNRPRPLPTTSSQVTLPFEVVVN